MPASRRHRRRNVQPKVSLEHQDPDQLKPPAIAEVKLFGRAVKAGWQIPQVARTEGIRMLRRVSQGSDPRAAVQAIRILALIDQREVDLALQAHNLTLKREQLDLKREQLGLERQLLDQGRDTDIHLTVEFRDDPVPGAPA